MPEDKKKKVVYLAGPITGVRHYWEPFEKADDMLSSKGFTVMNPARLPKGLTNEQYARICFGMINNADAVLFLPGWHKSQGASLEWSYCKYVDKPTLYDIKELLEVLR